LIFNTAGVARCGQRLNHLSQGHRHRRLGRGSPACATLGLIRLRLWLRRPALLGIPDFRLYKAYKKH
jgi:hypothetical protein